MLCLRRPTAEAIQVFLAAQTRLNLTYSAVGASATTPPAGYVVDHTRIRKHVSFMYSYPNYVPLPASVVERIVRAVEPFEYDRVYGAFWDMVIERDEKAAVGPALPSGHRAVRQAKASAARPAWQ
jgi:hypothetical protein